MQNATYMHQIFIYEIFTYVNYGINGYIIEQTFIDISSHYRTLVPLIGSIHSNKEISLP
jgi:hypothetical protein